MLSNGSIGVFPTRTFCPPIRGTSCRRASQLEVDLSGFPNVAAHFKRMQERPSVKKLLAFEKEVQEGFVNTA